MAKGVVKFKDSNGQYQEYVLSKPITTVGRSRSNDIVIDDTSISRLHVRIEERSGQYVIIDNNSSNGTFVNRKKINESPIYDGDTLIVGRVYVYFTRPGEVPAEGRTEAMPVMTDELAEAVSAPTASFKAFEPQPPMGSSEADDTLRERPAPSFSLPPIPEPPKVLDESVTVDLMQNKGPLVLPPPPPAQTFSPSMSTMSARTVQPASLLRRFLAQLIDGVIIFLVIALPSLLVGQLGFSMLSLLVSFLGSIASIAYVAVGWNRFGKTVGKHLMHMRVALNSDPREIGLPWKTIAIRLLVTYASGFFMGLPFLYVFFNRDHRALHDLAADTFVVED